MFSSLTGWLHITKYPEHRNQLLAGLNHGQSEACRFCHVSADRGFDIVYEDDIFIAFVDHNPSSVHHILLVPKAHVESVKALRKSDAALVRSMEEVGHRILDGLDVAPHMRKLGFHIPPFNSVQHLHLHLQGLPYKSLVRWMKYPVIQGGERFVKGFSWFAEVRQVARLLEKDRRVGVLPC